MDILIFSQFHPKIYEIDKGCVKKSKEAKNRLFCLKSLRERSTGLRVLEQLSRRKKVQKKVEKWAFDFFKRLEKRLYLTKPFLFSFFNFICIGNRLGLDWE
jgi:hypothetical protein